MLKKIEIITINILFLIFSIYILTLNIISINKISLLIVVICSVGLYLFIQKVLNLTNEKRLDTICKIILIINVFFLLYIGYKLRVSFNWDYGVIQKTAIHFAKNGYINADNLIYFARYPNNRLILIIIMSVYRLSNYIFGINHNEYYQNISIIINCIAIELVYILTYVLSKKTNGIKFAFLVLLAMELMIPIALYSPIFYTDTIGMIFTPLILILYFKFKETKKSKYIFLVSLFSMIGFEIKATIIFAILTILINIFCNNKIKDTFKICSFSFVTLIVAYIIFNSGMAYILGINKDISNKYEFPHVHHVMMALNPKYDGRYSYEDIKYTSSYQTKKEKTDADVKEIKNRLNQLTPIGVVNHMFYKKWVRTWTNPNFASSDYLSRDPIKISFLTQIFSMKGKYNNYSNNYMHIYWIIIILGLILSGIHHKDDYSISLVCKMMILLLALFLSIWECNPRYIVHLLPIIIFISINGWYKLPKIKKED